MESQYHSVNPGISHVIWLMLTCTVVAVNHPKNLRKDTEILIHKYGGVFTANQTRDTDLIVSSNLEGIIARLVTRCGFNAM